jgi:hypothetical protein
LDAPLGRHQVSLLHRYGFSEIWVDRAIQDSATAKGSEDLASPTSAHSRELEQLLGLFAAAVILAAGARRVGAPYPVFLALGGAMLAFVPSAPSFAVPPDLALALFVAPVLLDAAYDASLSVEKEIVFRRRLIWPRAFAAFPIVLAKIDTDADGVISEAEQRAYAERVLGDLSLTIDGDRLRLRLVSSKFARTEEMKEGRGDIRLEFITNVPPQRPLTEDSFSKIII